MKIFRPILKEISTVLLIALYVFMFAAVPAKPSIQKLMRLQPEIPA
jgi:hypothetical protein